ncbi:MAG: phytanoyl-CoA dioxygenase family protein [Chitinophagales bacterium]
MKRALDSKGFEIVEAVYSAKEIEEILQILMSKKLGNGFGVRTFLFDNPDIANKIFTSKLIEIIQRIVSNCNKSIKSIYFDKPPNANWIVNWHQDLTINLLPTRQKIAQGYKNWRTIKDRTVVQPNLTLLESIFTIRIHLDDCSKENGALRVIEGSHKKGCVNIKQWMINKEGVEHICEVKKGGVLIMKPLLLHSSRRTENQKNRRVIHIEFTEKALPDGLNWREKVAVRNTSENEMCASCGE